MPYSIKILDGKNADTIQTKLLSVVSKDARFVVKSCVSGQIILLNRVRLSFPKEYCGNHPGECVVTFFPQKKMKARYLEWDDWVIFHGLVNDVLDKLNVSADVWSKPQDAKGKFWMRKGSARRLKYDYSEQFDGRFGRPIRVWNCGTSDQFVTE